MEFYNKDQIAKKLGVCRRTIDTYLQRGMLSYVKIGRRVFITDEDLTEFIERNKQQAFAHLGITQLETVYHRINGNS